MEVLRPTRAEIDLGALVQNALRLAAAAEGAALYAVVKADAYGHGAVEVGRALAPHAAMLAVSLVEEGLELREAGIGCPILVMGGVFASRHDVVVASHLTPVVHREEDVQAFSREGEGGPPVGLHLKVDTGMSRLGVRWTEVGPFLDRLGTIPGVRWDGVCTHLANADLPEDGFTAIQLARFADARAELARRGIAPAVAHAANSSGLARYPEARLDAVRPGLALYRGAMRLVTQVVAVRDLEVGDTVSYGAVWRAQRPSRIAVLPVGYADGYPRRLTGHGEALIQGRRCPVVGSVCMDMIMIDVTDLGDRVQPGEEAVLLGRQEGEEITAAELAAAVGTVEYEILCGISKRVPRAYFGAGAAVDTIG